MLEYSCLLVHGWTQSTTPEGVSAWLRAITDANGRSLGFVRFEGDPRAAWFSWLRKARLDVFETEDASHLMSLGRMWGMLRVWDVYDAEDRLVGSIYPKTLTDPEGGHHGFLDRDRGGKGRILAVTGQVLARYGPKAPAVLELMFTPQAQANPFLCMLMLGSLLTLAPAPI